MATKEMLEIKEMIKNLSEKNSCILSIIDKETNTIDIRSADITQLNLAMTIVGLAQILVDNSNMKSIKEVFEKILDDDSLKIVSK